MGVPEDVPWTDPVINRREADKNPFDDTVFLISVFLAKDEHEVVPENFKNIAWVSVSTFIKKRKEIQDVCFNYPTGELVARWQQLRHRHNQGEEAGEVPVEIWEGVFDDKNFTAPSKYKPNVLSKYPLSDGGGAGSSGGGGGSESSGGGGSGSAGAESTGGGTGMKPGFQKVSEIVTIHESDEDDGDDDGTGERGGEKGDDDGSGERGGGKGDDDGSGERGGEKGEDDGSGERGGGKGDDDGSGKRGGEKGDDDGSGERGGGKGEDDGSGGRGKARNRCCRLF